MPALRRDMTRFQQIQDALELVVDQGFGGTDVDQADGPGRLLIQIGNNGQQGGFGFAAGGGAGDEDMRLAIQRGVDGGRLNVFQSLPVFAPDVLLQKGREPIEAAVFHQIWKLA